MKKISILILLSVLYSNNNFAQQQRGGDRAQPVTFSASPNAASLGTYGQVPVNLFNGQPNIHIGLYDLQSNDINIPISLSYNIAGIKPESHPGWTGLGWNLSAGGAITRIVNGGVDEVMVSGYTNPTVFSYYDNYGILNGSDWSSNANMQNLLSCMTSFGPSYSCAYPAPDEFMFNVNGLSGSFYKNHLGNWVVKANQKIDVKISDELKYDFVLNEEGNHITDTRDFNIKRIIYGFILTTDDGTQYIFGKNPNAIEFSAKADQVADTYHPNFVVKTWYLTQIIMPSQKQITFDYQRDPKATYVQNVSSDIQSYDTVSNNGSTTVTQSYTGGAYTNKSLERTFNVYLSKITSDDAEIFFNKSLSQELDFDSSNAAWGGYADDYTLHYANSYPNFKHWYKLDNIIVKRKSDGLQIKKITFNYLENSTSRLFLNNVQESGLVNTAVVKTHSFEYNQTPMPVYNAQKTDHWGYYNNINFFTTVTPNGMASNGVPIFTPQQLKDVYPSYRNSNPAVMQAGILTKIIYPTKGFSEFYYEPNDFSQVINRGLPTFTLIPATSQNEIGGGLRIKKIISNPSNSGANLVKEYFYVKDYKNNNLASSGVLSGRPVYYEDGSITNFSFWRFKSYSILPLSNTNGSDVTYTNVVEKSSDGSFTEYNYSNHDNGFMDKQGNAYLIRSGGTALSTDINHLNLNSFESERGNLLSEKKYTNQKVLVEKTDYLYNDDSNRFGNEIRSIDFYEDIFGTPQESPKGTLYNHMRAISKMTAYSIFTHQVYLKRTENTKYDLTNNSSITTTEDFTYSNLASHHHLKSKVSSTSNGNNFETKYFYAPDPEMANQPFISDLNSSNMKGIPLKTENYNGTEKIEEQKNTYAKDATTNNVLLPKKIYGAKFPNNLPSLPNDIGQLENKLTFDSYDDKGNITQYTQQDQIPVSVIWGYNKTQPIAKIENATYSQVQSQVANLQSVSDTGTEANLIVALNSLRTSLPNVMVTTFTFKPLMGVSTITDPKGQTTTYIYDDFNRLKQVKDNLGNILSENRYNYKN